MTHSEAFIWVIVGCLLVAATLAFSLPSIHAWERANDYLYGKLCELYWSCR